MHPLTLRFSGSHEREFLAQRLDATVRQIRVAWLLGLFLYAVFGVLDGWIIPDAAQTARFIRYVLVCPLIVILFLFSYTRYYPRHVAWTTCLMLLVAGAGIIAMTVVAAPPGSHLYYAGLIIVIIFSYVFLRLRFVYAAAVSWTLVAAYEVVAIWVTSVPLPILISNNFFFISSNVVGMFACYMLETYERRDFVQKQLIDQQRLQIAAEQERAERLLYDILPKPVAMRLRDTQQPIADSFADVTVLFADIANFSALAPQMPPTELVRLLNQIFSSFDALAEKRGLEKIKTIGDAYMVVGGLPMARDDHAEAIAELALDMLEEIGNHSSEDLAPLQLRIGLNTGPVVAGVIGKRRFIYDLWGDTVNIASRMESHGDPGTIQVTETTYLRLRRRYHLRERGVIHVKGRGDMRTYFLEGRKVRAAV